MIIISDIHGCFYTLLRLLEKCPMGHNIYLLGDLVDRGPHSKEVVEWAMSNAKGCTMGNHEHMMLDHICSHGEYDSEVWFMNGGREAMESFGGHVSEETLEWASSLPTSISVGIWMLSHTGHGHREDLSQLERVWVRDRPRYDDGHIHVFGHTPNKLVTAISHSICIDTGAAYEDRGLGVLTALVVPDPVSPAHYIIQQEYNETPIE